MASSFVESLLEFFRRPAEKGEAPPDVCVNCWGRYEYDGEIREAIRDRQIDVNAGRERYAFIQDFAVNHVDGIRLRDADKRCPRCGTVHG